MKNYKNELLKLLKNERVQIDISNYIKLAEEDLRNNRPLDDTCETLVYILDVNINYLTSLRNKIEKIGNDYSWDTAMED